MSRKHAKLIVGMNSLSIEDLNSVNGTYIQRKRLNQGQISLLRKELAIEFADCPEEYWIEEGNGGGE